LRLHHAPQAREDFDEVIHLDANITDAYLNRLRATGGTGNFSDAIYQVAVSLERRPLATPVVDLDWGFHFPLLALSQGSIHSVEAMDGSTSALRQFLSDPQVQYVAHAPGATNFPQGLQAFTVAATSAGLQVVREQRFTTRDGTPVIDLYVARPAAGGSDSESLLFEQGRGLVGQVHSDDQVRLLTDSSDSAPELLTIASAGTTFSVTVSDHAQLRFSIAQPENVWPVTTGAIGTVTVVDGDRRVEVFRRRLAARDVASDRAWSEALVDLSSFAGRTVLIEFAATPPPEGDKASWIIWRAPLLQ